MLEDRYGNALSTASDAARDAYVRGVDLYLSANYGVEDAFDDALAADPNFALAHIGIARNRHVNGHGKAAREALARARTAASAVTSREASHISALGLLIEGKSAEAYSAARAHLADHPRDAMVAQTCMGVFGLIGFSGQPGREAETLAFSEILAPHYGDDWWFLSALSFSQMEVGQIAPAETSIERAIALNPRNANAAHHRSHLYYEMGETETGYAYLNEWRRDYDKRALMHCHLSWHSALWALGRGDIETMWQVVDRDIDPEGALGPPLNVLTDMAAILYRAELAGVKVSSERWRRISDYAGQYFPKPGLAFADVHAALAHAMSGNGEALAKIVTDARGPARDMVVTLAEAFRAIAAGEWQAANASLTAAMADHARIGGSRAQRDLIDYMAVNVLLKMGRTQEARRLLAIRRPLTDTGRAVEGL